MRQGKRLMRQNMKQMNFCSNLNTMEGEKDNMILEIQENMKCIAGEVIRFSYM